MAELSFFDKIRKQQVLKKLNRDLNINDYKELNNSLKNDEDIKKMSLYCVKIPADFTIFDKEFLIKNIGKYPGNIQMLFYHQFGEESIKHLSQEIQINLIKENNKLIQYVNRDLQEDLVIKSPSLLSYLSAQEQSNLVLKHQKLFFALSIEMQVDLCQENHSFLFLFDDEKILKNIRKIPQELISLYTEKKRLSLENYFFLINIKYSLDEEKKILFFLDYPLIKSEDELFSFFKTNSGSGMLASVYKLPDSIQDKFYQFKNDILSQNAKGNMFVARGINFSISFFEKKFKEFYGEEKWNTYSSLFTNQSFISTSDVLFSLINGKNSIVLKNDSSKVVSFFQLMLKKDKTMEENAILYNKFYDLVGNTYGKQALSFLRERPGLNYEDISNIEIFSPNILKNFRRGFIDDLLSYEFGGYFDKLIEISTVEEELNAFKLLYSRFSLKFGENVETMLLTFSRYDKYQSILKEFVEKNISSEDDLEKLDALCTWPENIIKVEHISQLENLEESLSLALENNDTSNLMENSFFDYQLFSNFDAFNNLYDIKKYATKNMNKLDKNSLLLIKLFDENKNFFFNSSATIAKFLREYKRNGGNLSSFFQTMYQLMDDIREENENYFRDHIVTDKKYIDKKIEEHADNVHKISVFGIELYDLGDMEVNFACHKYNMANSVNSTLLPVLQKEYLSYDGNRGISTISARPIHGIWGIDGNDSSSNYIFWDFSDNHVMNLFSSNGFKDGNVSHDPGLVISHGGSNHALDNFQNVVSGNGEIAFYRRKRNHVAIESQKYGGKIIPNAISGGVSPVNLDLANGRFGKKIPILLKRGSLSSEKRRESVRRQVISTFIQLDKENRQSGNVINHHVPNNLKEIVSQELSTFSQDYLNNLNLYEALEENLEDVRYYELLKSYELERTNQIKM